MEIAKELEILQKIHDTLNRLSDKYTLNSKYLNGKKEIIQNFKLGKIYALRSPQSKKYYIGSTASPLLSKRIGHHREEYKRYLDKIYHFVTSFEILKYDDCYIELLEEFPCENRMQLVKREGEIQRERKNDIVNRCIAGRTQKEYYNENIKQCLKTRNEYRIKNADKIKEYKSQKIYCPCETTYRVDDDARHKRSKKHQKYILSLD